MAKRLLKTLIFGVAMAGVVAFSAMFAACNVETKHPEVKITIEFDSQTYDLEYTLYRNMYPQTVRHFIELADNGFYNDMIVHDYTTSDWFTGGYSYDEAAYASAVTGNSVGDYLEQHDKEDGYDELFIAGKLTPSVYKNSNITSANALRTLMGEYKNNIQQEIEKGALTAQYGTLKMFYYAKQTTQQVVVTPSSDQAITANYKNNCATSLFMIQVSSSSSYSADSYCTFATINNSGVLDDLVDAISDYIEKYYEDTTSNFTTSATVRVDNNDEFSTKSETDRAISKSFKVARTALVVKSVSVTKY